ncbi:hypothetical protein ILYODFUR_026916 [Ilyodon furcidens]|uniref:Secreted protein n=1 Tax=Ilyodon furcidens TaxID=33524 RepID=A0ABV0U954_9TELE
MFSSFCATEYFLPAELFLFPRCFVLHVQDLTGSWFRWSCCGPEVQKHQNQKQMNFPDETPRPTTRFCSSVIVETLTREVELEPMTA